MKVTVIAVLPELVQATLSQSILKRALDKGLFDVELVSLRDFASPPHHRVDERPYGGGAGMLLSCEPIAKALEAVDPKRAARRVLLSARGERFNQSVAQSFVEMEHLILLCGRYEGVDQRIADHYVDQELSLGDFVLMGGEAAAACVLESCFRLIPGVLGNFDSLAEESFSQSLDLLEQAQYTRPREFEGHKVPDVLVSGNHGKLKTWRSQNKISRKAP